MLRHRIKLIFLFVLCFSLNLYAVNITHAPTIKNINHFLKSSKIKLSKNSIKVAQSFTKAFEDSQSSFISNKRLSKLRKRMDSNSLFHEYSFWPYKLRQINKTKRLTKTVKICNSIADTKSSSVFSQRLLKSIELYCLNSFYHKLSTNKYSNKTLNAYLPFFQSSLQKSLKPKNKKRFYTFLQKLKPSTRVYKKYINSIEHFYMSQNILPPKKLLKNIVISSDFTRYLQIHGREHYSTNSIFTSELRKISRKAIKVIDDEEPNYDDVELKTFEILNYYNLTKTRYSQDSAKKILSRFAKSLLRRDYVKLSKRVYKNLIDDMKTPDTELVFEYFWTYLSHHEYEEGIKNVITQYLPNPESRLSNTKLNFWYAYSLKKLGNETSAHSVFQDIVTHNPLSYYAIIASKELHSQDQLPSNQIYLDLLSKWQVNDFNFKYLNTKEINHLKRIVLWSRINKSKFLNLELKQIQKQYTDIKKSKILLAAATIMSKDRNYLDSFKVIYKSVNNRSLNVDKSVLGILFPKPFYRNVKRKSKSFDPFITLSLIRQESGFNSRATSRVGALGLMQLMPATARQFKRRLKHRHLFSPDLNIRIGTKYLKNLLNRYDGNLVYSLAAYNAGESRVDKWQNKYLTDTSILHNIENIPFLETKKYVKLIFRNIFFYKLLENNKMNDTNSLNHIYDVKLGFNI